MCTTKRKGKKESHYFIILLFGNKLQESHYLMAFNAKPPAIDVGVVVYMPVK
jgi:hypothetical protein